MIDKFVREITHYDGSQLSSLWAFRNFGIQGDSIISFRGSCDVQLSHMVDLADVRAGDSIYSEDMLHFIIEHFDMDLEKTVTRQRLLISIIKELLEEETSCRLIRRGDDLYQGSRKLSVSIATLSPVSTMIHTGINISSHNTPVPTVSISELGWPEDRSEELAAEICARYVAEINSIKMARCKVRGVD
ncbi:hypothetical protein JOC37_001679 [Desulfohalotomaculum tongense]|uniref:DUF366 family protein n=1 Tax=Desulforadius tongensis TaxID=1216062 RepID=UPI00195B0E64|nr:DUF366 family protein [Desulforadius tongensis]MBM7855286.1 hypothetical protein [Desulforadius tongensis]